MQLTMEPLAEMLETARALDRGGFDTIWLAEAYPWWRKHGMEARSSTVLSALMARETERLTIGWGIISPYTRHPVQVAMDARIVQEAAGPGPLHRRLRHLEDLPEQHEAGRPAERDEAARAHARLGRDRARRARRRAVRLRRQGLQRRPARRSQPEARRARLGRARSTSPATAPRMQQLGGEIGDGLLTPSITTPAFVRYTRGNVAQGAAKAGRDPAEVDVGCTIVASIHATDRDAGRDGRARDRRHVPREQVPEHPGLGRHAARARRDRAWRRSARSPRRWSAAAGSPRRPRSPTRCSTAASRSPARRPTASPRSRSTARPAARTSCSSSGARTGTSRSGSSPSGCCPHVR